MSDLDRWHMAMQDVITPDPMLLGLAPDGLPWDAPVDENGQRYSRQVDCRLPLPREKCCMNCYGPCRLMKEHHDPRK